MKLPSGTSIMNVPAFQFAATRDFKLVVIGLSLLFAFGVILLGLLNDVLIITPLLFYIPIIVAAYWFPKKAIPFAMCVGGANILIVYLYSYSSVRSLTYTTATASFYVLIALTLVISSLAQKMEAQEIRYRGVFNYSENGIFLIVLERKDPIINEVNSKGLSLLGFDRKTILGKSLSEIVPDSTSRTQILEQIRDGRLPVTETVLKRNDGTTIPVLISGAGTPEGMVILNVTDIRDRKTAEDRLQHSLEEKEILLREVHHRVKNNMQVISGLIELQSAQITDPAILRLFQESYNRIKTMSLIHESLYRSNNYAHLDFSAYLSDLVSYLFTSYGRSTDDITVDIHLEKTKLPLDIAVPCGLIANELISNSLKHAFPQGRHGTISIRLTKREGNEWEFVVSDNGIGMPANLDVKTASTFGLQLIRGLADHQMRGKVEFRQGNGTTVVIRFPCGR